MKTSKTNNWVLLKKEAFVKEEPETLSQSQAELAAAEPTKKKNSNLQLCLQLWPDKKREQRESSRSKDATAKKIEQIREREADLRAGMEAARWLID